MRQNSVPSVRNRLAACWTGPSRDGGWRIGFLGPVDEASPAGLANDLALLVDDDRFEPLSQAAAGLLAWAEKPASRPAPVDSRPRSGRARSVR
jgi:hypothetical protein